MTCDWFRSIALLSASKTHCFSCYQCPMPEITFPTFFLLKSAPIMSPYWHLALNSSPLVASSIAKDSQSIYQVIQSFVELYSDHDSNISTGPSECILLPKWPIYPCLDCLYQEMVVLHRCNKLQGLSTHRHNIRHTLCLYSHDVPGSPSYPLP